MKVELLKALYDLYETLDIQREDIAIYPSSHADLTTNIAFQLSKHLKLSPKDCAVKLVNSLSLPDGIVTIQATTQGLINFSYADGFKTKLIKDLMELTIPWKKIDEEQLLASDLESRIFAWKKSLTQFGIESFFSQLTFGQTSLSQDYHKKDILQFFYLSCPSSADLHLSVKAINENSIDNPWYAIDYAIKRNYFVVESLKARGFKPSDVIYSDQWPMFSNDLLAQLLRFNWHVEDIQQHGRVDELFTYIKNLARTMHCYYNKVTLLNNNPMMCSANFMLLQAAQRVLTGSLKLLGVNIE